MSPSFVRRIRPSESLSSRPMGKMRSACADQVDDVVLDMRFGGAGDAGRLVESDVNLLLLGADQLAVDAHLVARGNPGAQCGAWPLQVTRPASIHLSASRLEQTPVSLMYLLSRTVRSLSRASAAAQERANLLRQFLRGGAERIAAVACDIDHPMSLFDLGQAFRGRNAGQYQASHQFRAHGSEFHGGFGAVLDSKQVDLAQPQSIGQVGNRYRGIRDAARGEGSDSPKPGRSGA